MRALLRTCAALFAALQILGGCASSPPEGLSAVAPFDVDRYIGKWYEIARLDHRFERGLSDVSASYQKQADGSLEVVNRGYDEKRGEWRQATGRAVFAGDVNRGSLKVSFFPPFYGGYHVVALDRDYRWALVVGPDRGYFWILARDRQLAPGLREQLVAEAGKAGIDVSKLIWVGQTRGDG